MKLTLELGIFMMYIGILGIWTRWFLPIHIRYVRYPSTGYLQLSFLWLIHLNFRFPLPFKADANKSFFAS